MNETSYRIMKTHEFEMQNSTFFRATCDCGDPQCDITLILEYDEKLPHMIDLILHKELHWSSYWAFPDTWYNRLKKRIGGTLRMLFTGYMKVEETFVFQGEKHIQEFLGALSNQLGVIKQRGSTQGKN